MLERSVLVFCAKAPPLKSAVPSNAAARYFDFILSSSVEAASAVIAVSATKWRRIAAASLVFKETMAEPEHSARLEPVHSPGTARLLQRSLPDITKSNWRPTSTRIYLRARRSLLRSH